MQVIVSGFRCLIAIGLLATSVGAESPPQFLGEITDMGDGQFDDPVGIALDTMGNVYVVDQGNNRIQKFDSNGNFIHAWGSLGEGDGQFVNPEAVAVDELGTVYVTYGDRDGTMYQRVLKFDSSGGFLMHWDLAPTVTPKGIVVDDSGNVFVVNQRSSVLKFDSAGNLLLEWGAFGSGDGEFWSPTGVAVDAAGNVYVADTGNERIQKFNTNGTFLDKWLVTGPNINGDPVGVAVRGDSLFVIQKQSARVQKFDLNGNFSSSSSAWGNCGSYDGEFLSPCGIAVDAAGNAYIADTGNHRVQKYTGTGDFLTQWGNEQPTQLRGSLGLTVHAGSGAIYVVSRGRRIVQLNSDGSFARSWTWPDFTLFCAPIPPSPGDIAVDPSGYTYVVDLAVDLVRVFDSLGAEITPTWPGSPGLNFEFHTNVPVGIATSLVDDRVYVVDPGNTRVVQFKRNGTFLTEWGEPGSGDGQFTDPTGVALDSDGSVYVTDRQAHRIQKFDADGTFLGKWGSPGSGDGEFNFPSAVEVDINDNVYVVDSGNHRVQKFTSSGEFLTKWGSYGNLPGEFNFPEGIGISLDGTIYVSDGRNNRIQQFGFDDRPRLISVLDVGNDQGRQVRLRFQRSGQDAFNTAPTSIVQYELFRRIDPLAAKASSTTVAQPAPVRGLDRQMISDPRILTAGWDFLGALPAHGEVEYNIVASTLADSTISRGMHWSVFFVRAATSAPLDFFDSPPDSGYSLDNLAPFAPPVFSVSYVAGTGYELGWDPSPDEDLQYYRVYRGARPDFDVLPGDEPVYQTTETQWTDDEPTTTAYYKLSAVDFSGNESELRGSGASSPTDAGEHLPGRFTLHQNTPNPFNPRTMIRYEVPAGGGRVRIRIFNAAGRELRTLVDRHENPGYKSIVWDGLDNQGREAPTGIYFYHLTAPRVTETRKMTLLR